MQDYISGRAMDSIHPSGRPPRKSRKIMGPLSGAEEGAGREALGIPAADAQFSGISAKTLGKRRANR